MEWLKTKNMMDLQLCIIKMEIFTMGMFIKENRMEKAFIIIITYKNGIGINILMEN